MPSRKRAREEMEAEEPAEEPTVLHKLRNMWQFANLAQYLHNFIDALRVDKDFDIEDLEMECLKPHPSEKLAQLGLALLKHVSSHKGLTPEIFDEYTRRQFVAKAPQRNPFGTEEEPLKFDDFDIFTKIRVLQQLSVWTLNNPNSIREKLLPTDAEQQTWRIEPLGWDREDRTIYVLDDNRLYRQTDPPPPPAPKAKSKAKSKKSKSTRSSKRRKTSTPQPEVEVEEDEEPDTKGNTEPEDDGLGGSKWECICITLEEYQEYLNTLRKSKDPNEKVLYRSILEDIFPLIERQAEERAKKEARRMKEQENLLKLATAKRSSRISARVEKQKEVEAAEEVERRRLADLAMAKAEEEKQRKMEEDRDSRRMTREQRLKERETKRILEEETLRKLKEEKEKLESNEADQARISERQLRAELQRREQELQKLAEEDEWVFDCEKCGVHGDSYDDGTQLIACDKCNVWQHSKCHGITKAQAERADFVFVCKDCTRKEEEAKQPKLSLKFRLTSASPSSQKDAKLNGALSSGSPVRQPHSVQIPTQRPFAAASNPSPVRPVHQPVQALQNGPSLSPRGQALGPPGIQHSEAAYGQPRFYANGSSPVPTRPYSANHPGSVSITNGLPTSSSPPQYMSPPAAASPYANFNAPPYHQVEGSPYSGAPPFRTIQNPSYNNFDRPASSAGSGAPFGSPVKHSPAPSPKPANGVPNQYNFTNSPHSSFPPTSTQRPSFSPMKNSSPPPRLPQMSSPAPVPPHISPSPAQMPAQMLPYPIPAPEKHDTIRPMSSHSMSETPILPPIKALSPVAKAQNLSPPVKKTSPTPERPQFAPVSGNGYGGSQ